MKKKAVLFASLGLVLILVLAQVGMVNAWTGDEGLDDIYLQMHELRKQELERRVELGQLTPEEGEVILERMEERYEYRLENDGERFFCHGREGSGGFGRGFGHRMGFRRGGW